MSSTLPTDIYYKSRRFTVVVSFFLSLTIYGGAYLPEDGVICQIKLATPEYLPIIVTIILMYSIWEYFASWYVQKPEVRDGFINIIDCFFTGLISISPLSSIFYKFPSFCFWVIYIILLALWVFSFFPLVIFLYNNTVRKNKAIGEILLDKKWNLSFDPIRAKNKNIAFLEDGNIAEGKNNNEFTWRIQRGLLEILNRDGIIFSRFRYNKDKKQFEHTNDEDTLSRRNQIISETEPTS